MEVKHKQDGRHGTFYMEDNGKEIGVMVYAMTNPHKMVIEHTEVDEAYGGRGLGLQLVKAGVAYAREHDIKILPLCVFAKKVFDKTEEFRDVLV
jgi:predicted GNAT family acetyltransferase